MTITSEGMSPGDVLGGKYRVDRVIGRGGMGVVVAARHLTLHQSVAIKLLPDDQAKDAENVARFMREARAVVRLKSEHAIKVTDVGRRKNGAPYFVMELLEGEDIDTMVTRAPLPVTDAVDYVLQACEAVAEAHALGIIHRDIKPRNLFLSTGRDGRRIVKVLDFGLAKPVTAYGDVGLTATSTVLGSPQYMSPEQMRSTRDVDHRTDVWSLGVSLYEMLSRRMPFEADTVPVLCALVLKDQPKPVTHHRPEVPDGLAQVIARCLEKDPAARFADVQQLAAALEPYGSADSRGVSTRIAGVLRAVVPASIPPGETTTTFLAGKRKARREARGHQGIVIAIASSALVLGLTGAILIALHFSRAKDTPNGAADPDRGPAHVASAKKNALLTESRPKKAAASSEEGAAEAPPRTLPATPPPASAPGNSPPAPPARSERPDKPPENASERY